MAKHLLIIVILLMPCLSNAQIGGEFLPLAPGPDPYSSSIAKATNKEDIDYCYFKASRSFLRKQGTESDTGPFNTDCCILFSKCQIVVLDYTAKVYTIMKQSAGTTDDGKPYAFYRVLDAQGHQLNIVFIKKAFSKETNSRIIIDDDKYPISMIDGNTRTVY